MGDVGFDPRFDSRILEQQKLQDLTTTVEKRPSQDVPELYLPDYEGQAFVTSMSDRTAGGGALVDINGVPLKRPVDLQGGQSYMFENPGQVWASGDTPARAILMQAAAAKALTGKDPLYIPWRMAPTGSDFATMTGETMLSFAESNMSKSDKQLLNKDIKEFIPNWKGIDSPKSIEQFRATPDATRKAIKAMMDKKYRDEGGLNIGEARLSIADPNQLSSPTGYMMNVGRIFADKPLIEQSGHASYPKGVPGEGLGRVKDEKSLFEFYPKTFPEEGRGEKVIRPLLLDPKTAVNEYQKLPDIVQSRGISDPRSPTRDDTRALQMKPYYGILTQELLKKMGFAEGGMVESPTQEAIADTVQNPNAARMLEMDLANLALTQQPQRMKDGGTPVGDQSVFDLQRPPEPVPPTLREVMAEIGRDPKKYSAEFPPREFDRNTLEAYRLMQAAKETGNPERYLESLNPYFDSQIKFDIGAGDLAGYVDRDKPNLAVYQKLRDIENTVPHELTHTLQLQRGKGLDYEDDDIIRRGKALPDDMRRKIFSSKNSFENPMEAYANAAAYAHLVNAAGGDFVNTPEGKALLPDRKAQSDYYLKTMPGVDSAFGYRENQGEPPVVGIKNDPRLSYAQQVMRKLGFAEGGQAKFPTPEEMLIEMMERGYGRR